MHGFASNMWRHWWDESHACSNGAWYGGNGNIIIKLSQCTCYFYSVSVLMTSSFFNGSWFVSSLRTSRKAKVKAEFDDKKVRRVRQKINAIMRHIDGIIIFHKRHVTTPLINGNMVKNEQKWTTCRLFGRTTFFEKDCFTSSFCSKIKIKGRKVKLWQRVEVEGTAK